MFFTFYQQDLPEGQLCRYFIYSRADFRVFTPQGRHVAPIMVKFSSQERTVGPLLPANLTWIGLGVGVYGPHLK